MTVVGRVGLFRMVVGAAIVPGLQNTGTSLHEYRTSCNRVGDALLERERQKAGLMLPHDRRCILSAAEDRDQHVGEQEILPATALVPSAIGDWAFG